MDISKNIKDNLAQIFAVVEKDLALSTRFKLPLIMSFFNPVLNLILPLLVFGQIFSLKESFGAWDSQNFALYLLMANQFFIIVGIRNKFPNQFSVEKVWKTLYAIIIAPFNRRNLFFGIFFGYAIMGALPFTFFFILSLFIKPITIISVLSLFIFYFFISLIFSGIGLFLGALAISKPSITPLVRFALSILWLFSCLTYPIEFFPKNFEALARLNPFFYIFDFGRAIWIDDNISLSIVTYPFHVFLIVGGAVVLPIVGLWIFNLIFDKYGIVGY